jgi:lipooligosaccharide transport system ATP-binding protein
MRFGSQRNRSVVDQVQGFADRVEVLPDRILLYADQGETSLAKIRAAGLMPMTSLVRRSSLEDVFLTLTGRTLID